MSLESIRYRDNPPIQCFAARIDYRMAHFHDDLEILYVLEGSVIIERKDEINTLKKDDILVIERNVVHSLRKTNEPHLLLTLQANLSHLSAISPDLLRMRLVRHLFSPGDDIQYQTLRSLFRRILDNYAQPAAVRSLKNMQLICDICILFFEEVEHILLPERDLIHEEKNNELLSLLLNYVQQNYMESPTLSEFGRQQGFSVEYLSRFFKRSMGITFSRYLSGVRTRRAEYLITHTEKSLLDICIECGFSNSGVFNRAFIENYACRPSEYRDFSQHTRVYFDTTEPEGESQRIIVSPMRIREYLENPEAAADNFFSVPS